MAVKAKALTGKKIGIFGKGGSGKSTVIVLLAEALAGRGYQVCILDADSTNLGLPQAFGFDRSPVSLMELFEGVLFVLNKVEDQATESYLQEKLCEKGIRPIGVIHRDPLISHSWLRGMPLNPGETEMDLATIVDELESAEKASAEVHS